MTTERDRQKRIAQDHYHDAFYVGTDAAGATHWFSLYHQAVVVIEADDVATVELPVSDGGDPIDDLGSWKRYTDAHRGWEECLISESLLAQAQEVLA